MKKNRNLPTNSLEPNFRIGDWDVGGLHWYHGTGASYGDRILADGFVRARESDDYSKYSGPNDPLLPIPGRVYVSSSVGAASRYAMDAILFEKWHPHENKYCYVFEVDPGYDTDVVLDEDLLAEDPYLMNELAKRIGIDACATADEHRTCKDLEDDVAASKQLVTVASDELSIEFVDRIYKAKGHINLAMKAPVRVARAWRLDLDGSPRRVSLSSQESFFWKKAQEVELELKRNGQQYYVWVVDEDGYPFDYDGVSGPHELQNAKDYARIAASTGKRARAVTLGSDPLAKTFKVVRVYEAGVK